MLNYRLSYQYWPWEVGNYRLSFFFIFNEQCWRETMKISILRLLLCNCRSHANEELHHFITHCSCPSACSLCSQFFPPNTVWIIRTYRARDGTTEHFFWTYSIAMPQCFPALSPAAWKPDRPMRATVGVMVRGPMYLSRIPGRPSAPIHTSTRDETMMAPWIWQERESVETGKKVNETKKLWIRKLPTSTVFQKKLHPKQRWID